MNYYVKGICEDSFGAIGEDECIGERLSERYCTSNPDCFSKTITCPNGCVDGACINATEPEANATCIDSDGGLNYFVKGSVNETGRTYSLDDYCNGAKLIETYCAQTPKYESYTRREEYNCPDGCVDGACVGVDDISIQSCQDASSLITSPRHLMIENLFWELVYNHTYVDSYDSTRNSYASWRYSNSNNYGSEYSYADVSVAELTDEQQVEEHLKWALESQLCDKERVYSKDRDEEDYETVYLCKNLWRIANEAQNTPQRDAWSYQNDVVAIWFNGNNFFSMEFSTNNYNDCIDSESCQRREQETQRRRQEDLIEAFDRMRDNGAEWVGNGNLDYRQRQFVNAFLQGCGSDIEGPEGYLGSWACKLEPAVCPPHGQQTEICTRWNENLNEREKREMTLDCSPGICSGCYVPKWFGSIGDNKCIPYGFRFEHAFDSFDEAFYNEEYDEIVVSDFNDDFRDGMLRVEVTGEDSLSVYFNKVKFEAGIEESVYSISISPDEVSGDYDIYRISSGDKANITFKEFAGANEEKLSIALGDIEYDSEEPNASVVSIIVGFSGTRNRPLTMNAYCDINGRVKEQKTQPWESCQNNYECESNLCSYGECVDLKGIADQANQVKVFFVRILCRIGNMFDDEDYAQCVNNNLGLIETSSSSGGGSSGGGSSA